MAIGNDETDVVASTASGAAGADPARLSAHLAEFAALSEGGPGVTRLAYTPMERKAHDRFAAHMRELGLTVRTDPAGNTIAELAGSGRTSAAIGTGSHLDSVPQAGRFDGIAGVSVAMEVARLAVEAGLRPTHPLRFVVFAAEEGARFGQACIGSRLAAGTMTAEDLATRRDADGVTLAEAMQSVGIDPHAAATTPWHREDWAAFIELHVEQGGVLEATGTPIGVVDLVSGSTRLLLSLSGTASHTGATPMALRADALAAAAEIVLTAESLANDVRHRGTRATVGRLDVHPGSVTTIPGNASMTVDVRDIDSDRQRWTALEVVRRSQAICDRRGVRLEVTVMGDTSPVVLPIWLRGLVADTATQHGVPYRVMTSGASHDAQVVNAVTPSAIMFVPSRGGLSHVPEEWTSPVDLALGADLLLDALRRVDVELTALMDR
jgi:allantoate deiminase/N-carbamoyl-L-amino-acid hydrolase